MSLSRTSLGLAAAAAASAFVLRPADAQVLPTDVQPSCVLTPSAFAAMFVGGRVTLDGAVNPADSLVNPGISGQNCPFFLWADQMYLWLTSPVGGSGRGSGPVTRTMFSSSFYTVSPPDANHVRHFVPNVVGAPVAMGLRTSKPTTMHPLLRARSGHIVQVLPGAPAAAESPTVRLRRGGSARIARVLRARSGALRFFDAAGRELQLRRPTLPRARPPAVVLRGGERAPVVAPNDPSTIRVRRVLVGGTPIFLDPNGDVVDVEEGQAGTDGVLIAQPAAPGQPPQPSQLVYYMIAVNDVYAYHRTMQGATVGPNVVFPQNQTDVNAIATYAQHNRLPPLTDPQALAIETKSSWVEESNVRHPENYIRIQATLPVFDTSNPNQWTLTGQTRTATMVMVGLHVVGSTQGHGEMVWASFEHFNNAPNAAYSYTNSSGAVVTMPQNTTGSWLFAPSGSAGPFNVEPAKWVAPNIVGWPDTPAPGSPVAAATVLRTAPWGTTPGTASNAVSPNTDMISLNGSRMGQLVPGDVRRNYFQLGAIWTNGGTAPSSKSTTNHRGSLGLANATLETFVQGTTASRQVNCFGCHTSSSSTNPTAPATVGVSHIYNVLAPLPLSPNTRPR